MKIKMRQSSINTYYGYVYMEKGLQHINDTIDLYCKLIKDDDIPFDEYIDIINKLYNIQITDNDLLRISSIILGDTSKSVILSTNIMYDVIKNTQVTNYFEYFEEECKLYLKVSFTDDNVIDFNHVYTSSEINKLINDRKIVLLQFVLNEEDDMDFYEVDEIKGLSPINNVTYENFLNIKDINEDYIPYFLTYFKSYFTIYRLKEDLNTYTNITKTKLEVLENYIIKKQGNKYTRVKKFNNILIESKKIRRRKVSFD